MPLQITRNKKVDQAGYITKDQISTMVKKYRKDRKKDKDSLHAAHFTVLEILSLFVANKVIPALSAEQETQAKKFGVKIYVANHAGDRDTCPAPRREQYKDSDTVVLCNTELFDITGKYIWKDMLKESEFVSVPGTGDEGMGLDRGSICPPDCPGTLDGDGYDHDDIATRR